MDRRQAQGNPHRAQGGRELRSRRGEHQDFRDLHRVLRGAVAPHPPRHGRGVWPPHGHGDRAEHQRSQRRGRAVWQGHRGDRLRQAPRPAGGAVRLRRRGPALRRPRHQQAPCGGHALQVQLQEAVHANDDGGPGGKRKPRGASEGHYAPDWGSGQDAGGQGDGRQGSRGVGLQALRAVHWCGMRTVHHLTVVLQCCITELL
mmetsp:Transcript_30490/g.59555  ORF Transcript_30490/g.59555 Transcript_30490/m.59555 type:complete len:202 (-) Transcript_30490:946-1551(-)